MSARDTAERLRQEAIQTLLAERDAIDEMLKTLGYDRAMGGKRRGRPPKHAAAPLAETQQSQQESAEMEQAGYT